ncbi:NAD(P)H-binding protein [Thioalkalivibrio sp. XN279]|uniref:NAD(P)H-binding protein n=1 Tax=Thioalkalivibrio sp. XN279 TaxID=2714953 RepID=UPI00140B1FED|nr:NAD(P)H-binding protein [Thioalkalivibrio sp. XN279]NHA14112.1 NAD(P)H-binding protein [Thioalkalivibrio sp. XN279]
MPPSCTTVFGGTGFLGSRIVRCLAEAGGHVRIAARHPECPHWAMPGHEIELVAADITDPGTFARALRGADAVVNAVSLYVEKRGGPSFQDVHVRGAADLAQHAGTQRVRRFLHVSGLGVHPESPSSFVRAGWRGEELVRSAFRGAAILRPSVLFGTGDALLGGLEFATRMPVVPLFGSGRVRLAPVLADDLAEAAAHLLGDDAPPAPVYEFGGGENLSYRELVEGVLAAQGRRRLLMPMPMFAWRFLATLMGLLPNPPLTYDQVVLMARDNVPRGDWPGFGELGIQPRGVLEWLGSQASSSTARRVA